MTRLSKRLATPLLCLSLCLPAQADDAARIVGGILGAIVQEQSRQQQQRDLQRQQQYQQQQYQQQPQRRQQNAQRQAPAAPQPKQPRMSLAERKAVQRALREAGFYGGAIDGALGPGSRKAIAAWQESVGATPSGYLAPRQASTLVAQAPAPDPEPAQDHAGTAQPADQPLDSGAAFPEAAETALFPETPAEGAAPTAASAAEFDPAGAEVIRDGDHLHAAYLFWALSRAPEQIWTPTIARNYGKLPMADGNPPPYGLQQAQLRPLVEAAVTHYGQHPPRLAVLDLPLQKGTNNKDENGLDQRATHWFPEMRGNLTDISGVPAITALQLRGASGGLELHLASEKPFFLAVPADYRTAWAQPVNGSGRPVLRVEMELSGLEPSTDLTAWPMGKARIAIQRATLLVASAEDRATGARDERVLHVWTGAAPEAQKIDRPADAAAIAAIYGIPEQAGRILTTPERDTQTRRVQRKDQPRALLQEDGYGSGQNGLQLLELAMRLGALIDAGPDRVLDPRLAQQAANALLSRRERVELLPTALAMDGASGYANGLSELSVRKAMNQAEPQLRQLISGRAPQFPVPLRAIMPVQLGEYDFDAGGFPLTIQREYAAWLPDLVSGQPPAVPQFFRIDVDNAEKLLAHLNKAGSMGQRTVYLVADYAVAAMRVRPAGSDPIGAAELETVAPQVHVEALALFADPGARTRIRDLEVPAALAAQAPDQAQAQAGAVPDEIFATSGKSLMAAVAVRHPGALEAGMLDPYEIANLPADRRGNRAADYRAELPGLALDSYWIAAVMLIDAYDPELGGFPTRQVNFQAVPYDKDLSGVTPPNLAAASRTDYELLRVPADQAVAVAGMADANGALHMFLKVPIVDATAREEEHPALKLGAPTEAIFGRGNQFPWPDAPELRLALAAPDRLAWVLADPAKPSAVPKALMLDPEGLDLLALAVQPDLYDDAGYRRMLLQRMAKERAAADGTMALDWDRFFRDPARTMEPSEIDAMLPAFRDWSRARVALLPQQVLLPVASGNTHPLTGCLGASELGRIGQENEDKLFSANAQGLLGQPLPRVEKLLAMNGNRARPGPARLWTLGMAGQGPASNCQYLRSGNDGTASGSYADLLLQVDAQPDLGRLAETSLAAASYELTLTERRLIPADQLSAAPEGLRGMLVLKAAVQGVQLFGSKPGSGAVVQVGHLQPGDWQAVTGTPPKAQDVLGMTLGMALADFDKAARAHLPQADVFATVKPGTGPFGTATGYVDPATGEALAAVYAPQSPDKTVVAIMRQLELPEAEISVDGLKASLVEKYGPAISEYRDTAWAWGTLPPDEDAYGFCGGPSTLNPQSAEGQPELGSDDPAVQQRAQASRRGDAGFWRSFGWPMVVLGGTGTGTGAEPELARCGPVVTVRIERYAKPDTVILRLWLLNRKLAEDLAAAAAPAEPPKPKVKF
ncbi:peptidoglycan-binding protein [Paracoccus aminovorans]|uniref:peptidoglycan-binding protein n=1 Tax=Paracoccus aminovorans TaxID=34004 RepID=UPI0007866E1C|nr:peptidoglycan-binding protein [Paracoccus aminovorans]MDQ7777436.1 peptidoglycan-binding domain-containing protein [Paracoccus aminovorans]